MKLAHPFACAAGGWLFVLTMACCATAQEKPAYFRLVDEASGYYHSSVDKELFVNRSARNTRKNNVGKICSGLGGASLRDGQADFDAWFEKYYYPLMTDPKELPNLSKLRRELMRDYFNRIKNEPSGLAVRDHLNQITLTYLQKLATNNLHPAVRYNAMLIIGDLDDRAAETTGGAKPAEPMFKALDVLQSELTSPTQIDAVRVAALIGLRRHALLNRGRAADKQWTEAQTTSLAKSIGAIAAAKKPPTGRSIEGHVWMRRLALETLGELAAARPNPAVTTLIDRIVDDPSESLDLRVAAAKTQGMIKGPLPMGTKPGDAAAKIARVGLDAIVADMEYLKHYADRLEREALAADTRGGFDGRRFTDRGSGGLSILDRSGDSSKEDNAPVIRDPVVSSSQRRLKTRLEAVRVGLVGDDGASGLLAAGDKAAIDKLASAVADVQTMLDKAPLGDPVALEDLNSFYDQIAGKTEALEELLPAEKPVDSGPATTDGPSDGPATDGPVADGPATDGPAVDEGPVAEEPATGPAK